MKRHIRRLATVMLVAAALGTGTGLDAQDATETSALQDLLRYVPSEAALIESGWATVRFVDYEALFESEGLSLFRALGDVDFLMNAVPLGSILSRIAAGPEALAYLFASAGHMKDVVGFEWLLDVNCSLEFGDPPGIGLLLGGSFDAVEIGAVLENRGFSLGEIEGVPVWHRFDDMAISVAARDVADPFGGHLGAAARIALLPDVLGNTRAWPLIEAMISAGQSTRPSLADDRIYQVLAEAVSEPDGLLIQALFFSAIAPRVPGDADQSNREPMDEADVLPLYLGTVLADRQEGDDQVHLIAFVCADEPTALNAADVLIRRLEAFRLTCGSGDVLVERYGAAVRVRDVRQAEDGLGVAVVEARYPVPAVRIDPKSGKYMTRGLLFRAWVQAILYREFTPLW